MSKLIYKKRCIDQIFVKDNSQEEHNIEKTLSLLNDFSLNEKEGKSLQYIALFRELLLNSNKEYFDAIIKRSCEILQKVVANMNDNILNTNSDEEKIQKLLNLINELNIKYCLIRKLIITNQIRFDSSLRKQFDTITNIKHLLNKFEYDNKELYTKIKVFIINHRKDRALLQKNIPLIRASCSSSFFQSIISEILQLKLEDFKKEVSIIEIKEVDKIIDYLNKYTKKINDDTYFYKIIFGQQESNSLNEQLNAIAFTHKLSNEFYSNELVLEDLVKDNNLQVLKTIEQLSRKRTGGYKSFSTLFFESFYKFVNNKCKVSETPSIVDGLKYISQLLEFSSLLFKIYNEVFKCSRQVHYIFNETMIKLSNLKNIQHFEYLLSVFIQENLYSNQNAVYSPAMKIIFNNLDNKQYFANQMKTFLLKRISTFKFELAQEEKFEAFLRENFEIRFIQKYSKIIKDVKESLVLNSSNISFFLLSNDALIKKDITQVLTIEGNSTIFFPIISLYNEQYPHRKVTISQFYTTAEIQFKKTTTIIANYIHALILQLFTTRNTNLTYTYIKQSLNVKNTSISLFRLCLLTLIQMNILIKKGDKSDILNDDIFTPNFDIKNNRVNCFERTLKALAKESSNETSSENKDNKEENTNSYSYARNINYIIQCRIIKCVKQQKDNLLQESEIIRKVFDDKSIVHLFKGSIDILLIKQMIEVLLRREFLDIVKIDDKLYYKYK